MNLPFCTVDVFMGHRFGARGGAGRAQKYRLGGRWTSLNAVETFGGFNTATACTASADVRCHRPVSSRCSLTGGVGRLRASLSADVAAILSTGREIRSLGELA